MSDQMLHGVLNMPMPYSPSELNVVAWIQFRDAARNASALIQTLQARITELEADRDRWYQTAMPKLDVADSTALRLAKAIARDQALEDAAAQCDAMHVMKMTGLGRDPSKYSSEFSLFATEIRAMKGGA